MSNGNELKKASIADLPCLKIGQKQCLCEISCEDCIESHVLAEGYRKQSEWISVEERLPNCEHGAESEAVLFITKQGFMYTGYYGCGGIFHDRYFREFKNATEGYDISNVTHWMPFPEAPKGGAE